jgi:hypothetical protein
VHRAEVHRVAGRGHRLKRRHRHVHASQPLAHQQLVLRVLQRVRARVHGDPVSHQCPQVRVGHVLVVERQHVAAAGKGPQHGQVAVATHGNIPAHQRGRIGGGLG